MISFSSLADQTSGHAPTTGLPRRIIFSRKGFDGTSGGCPSPVVDGVPISLPIPTGKYPALTRYRDLGGLIPELVADLAVKVSPDDLCHLDPDISFEALAQRPAGWRGAFGQIAQSQGHLANQGVGVGDLFLFWGLFREVERRRGRWTYVRRPFHAVLGWLQVGEVVSAYDGSLIRSQFPWLAMHPHAQDGWRADNTIYIAADRLDLGSEFEAPGFGTFRRPLVLTAEAANSPSVWRVPAWLHPHSGGTGMTYHPPERWQGGELLQSAARGQEFVAIVEGRPDAIGWARQVIEEFGDGIGVRFRTVERNRYACQLSCEY